MLLLAFALCLITDYTCTCHTSCACTVLGAVCALVGVENCMHMMLACVWRRRRRRRRRRREGGREEEEGEEGEGEEGECEMGYVTKTLVLYIFFVTCLDVHCSCRAKTCLSGLCN